MIDRSDPDLEAVDDSVSTDRVLLLVSGDRDRDLLADRLRERFEVIVGEPRETWERFDLCVVDASSYRQVKAALRARKLETALYLPVLLLVPDRMRAQDAGWLAEEMRGTVDDVIVIPAPKQELDARVEALLRARRQSRTLALYRRAMDEASVGVLITDPDRPDNPIVYANERFLELTGYDREAVLGRNCRFLQGPDTDDAPVREMREAIDAAEPVTVELLNYRADGQPFWNRVTVTPVRNEDGEVSHFLGFQEDITERVERERELDRERERFRTLARTATDAIVLVDTESRITYANEAVERIFGHAPADIEGESLTRLIPERLREAHCFGLQRYLDTGERRIDWETIRFPGLHADGSEIPLEVSFAEFESADERLFTGILRDVTEQERLEAELRAEKELLERMFDTSPIGITVVDTGGNIVRANEAAEEEFGLERSEILSRSYDAPEWEIFDEDGESIPSEDLPFSGVMRTGEPVEDYRHGIRIDGEERWLSINAAPLADEDGTPRGVVNAIQDITARRERERELERYETVVQTATEPIFLLDAEGRFLRTNDAMVEATGYSRAELLGSHVSRVVDEADVRRGEELIRGLLEGESDRATFEASLLTADGTRRQHAASMAVLHEDGRYEGTVIVAHDVTDLRRNERRLSVLDRVLRHNLRNKMNVVLGHAQDLVDAGDPSVAEHATVIRETATELLELSESARQFESVFRDGTERTTAVDLATLVADVVADVRCEHPAADISIALPDRATAQAHEMFDLALEELLENAVVHNDREVPGVEVSATVGSDAVEIRVADDGPGVTEMDRRVLSRGTESPLEHTQGLGLWLVRWTVEHVGGDIDIAENDPRGTVVTISLPRAVE